MNVSFNGFNKNVLTFMSDSDIPVGRPVKMSDNGKVGPCETGDEFIGIAVDSKMGYTSVQMTGYTKLPCTDTIAVGYNTIAADGNGGVCTSENGRKMLVVEVIGDTEIGVIM